MPASDARCAADIATKTRDSKASEIRRLRLISEIKPREANRKVPKLRRFDSRVKIQAKQVD